MHKRIKRKPVFISIRVEVKHIVKVKAYKRIRFGKIEKELYPLGFFVIEQRHFSVGEMPS